MRYIINDDDFEQWIEKLEEVLESLEGIDSEVEKWTLKYIIEEMKAELTQHLKRSNT